MRGLWKIDMPNKGETKYRKEMCETVIRLMKDGASIVEVCAELDISKPTIYEWCNKDSKYYKPDLSNSVKRGFLLCQAWWEKNGRQGLKDRDFNYTGWFMNMKNRFHGNKWDTTWKDKHTIEAEIKTETITLDLGEPIGDKPDE